MFTSSVTRNTARGRREQPRERRDRADVGGFLERRAPARHGVGKAQADERERGLGEHECGQQQRRLSRDESARRRQQVLQQDSTWRGAEGAGRFDVAQRALDGDDRADAARNPRRADHGEQQRDEHEDGRHRKHQRQRRAQRDDDVESPEARR